jgi:hypothetical protein
MTKSGERKLVRLDIEKSSFLDHFLLKPPRKASLRSSQTITDYVRKNTIFLKQTPPRLKIIPFSRTSFAPMEFLDGQYSKIERVGLSECSEKPPALAEGFLVSAC